MKLSVIIPVYNVAPYLRACLDSVAAAVRELADATSASLPRPCLVEVICVDDGSTDGSGAILDEYAERKVKKRGEGEERRDQCSLKKENSTVQPSTSNLQPHSYNLQPVFRVIHQKNAGVSAARNAALEVAKGEWVMMLDGDDTWAEDLLVRLFEKIAEHPDCDAVGFGLEFVNERGERTGELGQTNVAPAVMTGDEVLLNGRGPYSKFIWSSCDKIYRRSVIEKIPLRYTVGMKHGEDSLFSQVFLAYADKVVLCPNILGYRYLMREGSAIHVQQTAIPEQPFRAFEVLYGHWRKLKSPGLRLRLYYQAAGLPSLGKGEAFVPSVRPQAIELLVASDVFNKHVLPFTFRYGGWKARVFAGLYLMSPRFVRRKLLGVLV